ncbi:MAG: HAD family hydrolase [Ramlibacter sp.]
MTPRLALFDLDDTLLHGDTDVLWCDFLVQRGVLDGAAFTQRNEEMAARYRAGTASPLEFAEFYLGTLAGRSPAEWEPLRREFLQERIVPRIARAAMALVGRHREAGDLVVLTTATNRFLTELTAQHLGIEHVLATEPQLLGGLFSGRVAGTPNMREGKVTRLHAWLADRGESLGRMHSTAYSDSINDLPLLEAVDVAVVVHPDTRLAEVARERRWQVMEVR